MLEQIKLEEQAGSQVSALFAVIKKHGKYMVGGIDFQAEIRDTVIAVAQIISEPLERRIEEQEKAIQELRSTVADLRRNSQNPVL